VHFSYNLVICKKLFGTVKNSLLFSVNLRKNINTKTVNQNRSLSKSFSNLFQKFSPGVNPTDEFA